MGPTQTYQVIVQANNANPNQPEISRKIIYIDKCNALMSGHPDHLFYMWAHIWLTQHIHLQSTSTSSNFAPIEVKFFFSSMA